MEDILPDPDCQRAQLKFGTILDYDGVCPVRSYSKRAMWKTEMSVSYLTMAAVSPELFAGMTTTSRKFLEDGSPAKH